MKKIDIMKMWGDEIQTVLHDTPKAWITMVVKLKKQRPDVMFYVYRTHQPDYSFSTPDLETAINEFNEYN